MGKRILIADDDPTIVEATALLLEEFNYDVQATVDGNSIYAIQEHFPDLFLLDIWMSGQDGREICRYLKSSSQTKHIPVIMISASRNIKRSAMEAGADDFLAKPFAMNELIAKIEKHLQN
jgi:DNA-binding response OmpR family regulator